MSGVALILLLIMVGCFALGYGSAHTGVAQRSPDQTAIRLDLDRPEGRALIDRVGVLSGRLTLLESEAATLATRLGVGRPANPLPRGGPFIPLSLDATRPAAGASGAYGNAVVIDHGNGLATLYGHASRIFVRPGDLVMPQQALAAGDHDIGG